MEIIHQSQLPFIGVSHEFIGADHSRVNLSAEPGRGTWLHKHDYDEVVYVIAGPSKWTVKNAKPPRETSSSSKRASLTSS